MHKFRRGEGKEGAEGGRGGSSKQLRNVEHAFELYIEYTAYMAYMAYIVFIVFKHTYTYTLMHKFRMGRGGGAVSKQLRNVEHAYLAYVHM